MAGLAPFLDNLRQDRHRTHPDIHCPDHQVMSVAVIDLEIAVSIDPLLLSFPFLLELADRPLCQKREIPSDEPGVLSRQLHFPVEAEVVANEHLRAGHDPSREAFVVAVAQAEHERVVGVTALRLDLDQTEVSISAVTQGVSLVDDFQTGNPERALDLLNQPQMRDWRPSRRGNGCGYVFNVGAIDGGGSAVKN